MREAKLKFMYAVVSGDRGIENIMISFKEIAQSCTWELKSFINKVFYHSDETMRHKGNFTEVRLLQALLQQKRCSAIGT